MMDVDTQRTASPGSKSGRSIRSPAPGEANARLNFSLKEHAIHTKPRPEVVAAREEVKHHPSRDLLGAVPKGWNASSSPDASRSKFSATAAGDKLSNTLRPGLIDPSDFRRTLGSTFQPANTGPAELNRGTREWGCGASSWDSSTLPDSPQEAARKGEQLAIKAQTLTLKKAEALLGMTGSGTGSPIRGGTQASPGRYISPVQRQALIVEQVREKKRTEGVDIGALVEQYGEEGAQHMVHILELQKKKAASGSPIGSRSPVRSKPPPKQDILAVKELDHAPVHRMMAAGSAESMASGALDA